jgi:DNA-binding NarL/FixJ family response regulator
MHSLLLVDDHAIVLDGLALAIQHIDPGLRVATASSGRVALELARAMRDLDAVIMDFYLPDIGGTALVRRIRRLRPGVRVLVLSSSEEPLDARAALAAGAHAFIHKSFAGQVFIASLRRALAGESGIVHAPPQRTAAPILNEAEDACAYRMTRRQREVLQLVCEGLRNGEIAQRLQLSERTVKVHVSALFAVLGASNRTEAALVARRAGMLGMPC